MQSYANFLLLRSFGHEDAIFVFRCRGDRLVILEIRNSVHDYLRPLRQNVGQKVGQTSVRYYQVYVVPVGSGI